LGSHPNSDAAISTATGLEVDDVEVELRKKRKYQPDGETFAASLTDKQREVFETAINLEYYNSPRRVTHEDISEAVGLASSTVGEDPRKIESKLVNFVDSDPVMSPQYPCNRS
jgi:predicted DNA binding protein